MYIEKMPKQCLFEKFVHKMLMKLTPVEVNPFEVIPHPLLLISKVEEQ